MRNFLKYLFFSMMFISQIHLAKAKDYHFIVDAKGKGDFKTVQEAINAVPDFRKQTTIIYIKNGVYKEKLILPGSKKMVKFIGENKEKTILTFDDFAAKLNKFGEPIGTSGSSSFYIYGDDFSAENITFQNSSGPVGQAVAVQVIGDRIHFKNCRFLGYQDTLYTYGYGSRQYYENCYIEGTTDFIFGAATALFKSCEIYSKKGGSFVTAASTPDTIKYGYVFIDCKLTGDAPENSTYLGRPWRPFAKTIFIHCDLGKHIKPEGWDFWGKESNKRTAFYAEYQNKGEGFKPEQRVSWSFQLTENQIDSYKMELILKDWIPK